MNDLQWGFEFDQSACIQCLGCEAACKMWRRTELGVRWRRVNNIWHGTYPSVTSSSVLLSCMHCSEPACVLACAFDAIHKQADGRVLVDRDKCTGCRACLIACPFNAPQFGTDGLMQKCDLCPDKADARTDEAGAPPCVRTCPTSALTVRKMTRAEKLNSERRMRTITQAE